MEDLSQKATWLTVGNCWRPEGLFQLRGSHGHVYGTVALRIYQEDRGAERSKSTPD